MLPFPNIDPVIVSFGPLAISWYSLAYVVGILLGLWLIKNIARNNFSEVTPEHLDNFVTWVIVAIIVGGRLGYVCLYEPSKYFAEPIEILKTYKGGMSFHGGFLGFCLAAILFARKYDLRLLALTDLSAIATPIPIFLGRIANFINSELYGRVTDVAWSFKFPHSDGQNRHPSQLYEAFLEGICLFLILLYLGKNRKYLQNPGLISGFFLIFYGLFRIIAEFFREPDIQLGFILDEVTMGQILSLPMILFGICVIVYTRLKK